MYMATEGQVAVIKWEQFLSVPNFSYIDIILFVTIDPLLEASYKSDRSKTYHITGIVSSVDGVCNSHREQLHENTRDIQNVWMYKSLGIH